MEDFQDTSTAQDRWGDPAKATTAAGLTFQHLREVNVARCVEGWKHPLDSWSPSDWMVALGGEVGEALNVIKKLNRERDGIIGNAKNSAELLADLADELSDGVIYADLTAAAIGVGIDVRSFDAFRIGTERELSWRTRKTPSELGLGAICQAGRVGGVLADIEDGQATAESPALALGELVRALDLIALAYGIDLGAAVVSKFNRTSEKHGMPHRLVAA